jgi:hypothetical protein
VLGGGERRWLWNGTVKANKASPLWTRSGDERLRGWEARQLTGLVRPTPLLRKKPGSLAKEIAVRQDGREPRNYASMRQGEGPKRTKSRGLKRLED